MYAMYTRSGSDDRVLPAMQETHIQTLGQEDPLEKEMATPVLLPGESYGQRSLEGYSPRGHKESDMTKQLTFHFPSMYQKYVCYVYMYDKDTHTNMYIF